MAPKGGVLVGFNVVVGSFNGNPAISEVEPIYMLNLDRSHGLQHGNVGEHGEPMVVLAKPGYAVGGLTARSGKVLNGFRVTFMRRVGDSLDPNDKYDSEWIGGTEGSAEHSVGGDGKPAIGIFGTARALVHSLALIQAE